MDHAPGQVSSGGLGWAFGAADLDLDGHDDLIVATQTTTTHILFGGDI